MRDVRFGEAIFPAGAGFAQATFQRKALFFGATFRSPGPPRYSAPGLASTRLRTTLPTSSADRIKRRIAGTTAPRPAPAKSGRKQFLAAKGSGRRGQGQSSREPD